MFLLGVNEEPKFRRRLEEAIVYAYESISQAVPFVFSAQFSELEMEEVVEAGLRSLWKVYKEVISYPRCEHLSASVRRENIETGIEKERLCMLAARVVYC
jgi:hypothetical protein